MKKKRYSIQVDCANCAAKMEEAAKKVPGIANAAVSFLTQKMQVEFTPDADPRETMTAVLAACRKIERDCDISF